MREVARRLKLSWVGMSTRLRALWIVIVALFAGGVVTAVVGSLRTPHPEIIIETCSFAVALLLVLAERGYATTVRRSNAILSVVDELAAQAEALFAGLWSRPAARILREAQEPDYGLRYYYEHMATGATTRALLAGALDTGTDAEMISALHEWERLCHRCNARLEMAELHLFFLPRNQAGMTERLEVHYAIGSGPIREQRRQLVTVIDLLKRLDVDGAMPANVSARLGRIQRVVAGGRDFDAQMAIIDARLDATASPRQHTSQGPTRQPSERS